MTNKNNFHPDFNQSLPQEFFLQKTQVVAKNLLGKVLVKKIDNDEYLSGIIVETEAYLPENDLASHSSVGKTERNKAMFEKGGILYVYVIYGVHHCINIVTESEGLGSAVLIRALEPLTGIDKMCFNRKTDSILKLCKGPGCIAQALGFSKKDNFKSVCSPELFIQNFKIIADNQINKTLRIGTHKSLELLERYYVNTSEYISK